VRIVDNSQAEYQCARCQEQSTDQVLRRGKEGQWLCGDCYNEAPDNILGEITAWEFEPDDKNPLLVLQTEEGHQHTVPAPDEEAAKTLGSAYIGLLMVDRGDKIETEHIGPSPGDRVAEAARRVR